MIETEEDGGRLLLRGARLVLPQSLTGPSDIFIEDGRIASILDGTSAPRPRGPVREYDLNGLTLYPGFIDIHIHGALGVDTTDTDADGLRRVAAFLASRGVTAWLPTLVPAPDEDYKRAALAVGRLMGEQDAPGGVASARALGLHYEGPFVSERQCGALRTQFFRTYSRAEEIDALATVPYGGAVHMTTLAPEVGGGVELVRELIRRGWVVSIGHTRAEPAQLDRARDAGARHMTHFMNAMSPLHHRAPGPVGWGLVNDDVTCDLIADGVHSDPLVLDLVMRCKTPERVALISDAVAPAGLGDGEYSVWGETITVEGGRTRNERGSIAGSVITMHDAARLVSALGRPPHEVARMASLVPARVLGLEGDYGSIEVGKRADLTALDDAGRVRLTLVGGRVAFSDLTEMEM